MWTHRRWRVWPTSAALGLLLGVLVAVPAALSNAHLHWPAWLIASVTAVAGVVVSAVLTPLVSARVKVATDRLAAREEESRRQARAIRRTVGRDRLPLVSEVRSRAALGVHPATPLPADADPALSAELPLYVPRDRDGDVRTALTRMRTTGGLLLLVGPPAAGKTRCAAEAMQQLLGDWRLVLRLGAGDVAGLLDEGVSLARTVIWLDDVLN